MKKGAEFEDLAVEYLRSIGYQIIHRNYRCKGGELDIIALDGNRLVFVEVKGGKTKKLGDPAEKINRRKMRRLLSCIEEYLSKNPVENYSFEVVVVRGPSVEHIREVEFA
ncbi:MAG: YraN family protein [Aquificaceae bacterium]|nr:YraN family protein [Aquificaceae bacterium]